MITLLIKCNLILQKKFASNPEVARHSLELPADLVSDLKNIVTSESASLFNSVAAAIAVFLYRYFSQEDICLSYSNNSQHLVGSLVNELGLRMQLSEDLSFRSVLDDITQQSVMDKKHQDYPLIEAILAKLSLDAPDLKFPFNVGLTQTFSSSSQKYEEVIQDLLFSYEAINEEKPLIFAIDYNKAIFQTAFIQQMAAHLIQLLRGIVISPDEKIGQLELLSEKERSQ